ncbi:TetR/AcrR family transcriptional regulator [Nocardiopsis sp. MG754419]|uniref:TetR/AcrR family transcriptional regulator n=1 Tax=Nocardiopsis sp. MG754419 TaxID=2259865 RepID=UPI001BA9361C|nr:TetR family transcriptional regulator [Nocardiopsis sp. MG754419]
MSTQRDPRARRRAMVEAAADLIAETGALDITHRRVAERAQVPLGATTYYFSSLEELTAAAVGRLAERTDEGIAELEAELSGNEPTPAAIAASLWSYLSDTARVKADAVLYIAGSQREDLRPLALRWYEGMVRTLSGRVPAESARAIAVFSDGAMMHTLIHGAPMGRAEIERIVAALLASPGEGTGGAR